MKISIVTITYNNFSELKLTLDSIPNYDFVESVVINGGDCNETRELLKSYKGKSISEKDNGIADAFNKGIKIASGDLIMFLNSGDVLINPNYIKEGIKILKESPGYSFVHSNILYKDAFGDILLMKPKVKNIARGIKYLHPSMIVRSKIFNTIGSFNPVYKIAMDYDFILRMEKGGFVGFYLDSSPVVQMGGMGISHTSEYSGIKECARSLQENNYLTIKNIWGLSVRVILFFCRQVFLIIGGKSFLRKLKWMKYNTMQL